MEYIRLSDHSQQHIYNIRNDHPNVSIPDGADLSDIGYAPLSFVSQPTFNPATQKCYRDGCEKVGDAWQYKWRIDDLSSEQIAANQAAAYVASIPQVVSRAQFILALLQIDLLDEVEAAIALADRATQINYTERLEFERGFPLIATMAAVLGKTDAEVDALFVLAATL